MRILLIVFSALFSLNIQALDDKSMQELFKKYDAVIDTKKVDLIDEVFTEKFIRNSGGKKELTEKIQELSHPKGSPPKTKMTWRKGLKGKIYFAKVKEVSSKKSKTESEETEFIVVEENGKLKIDGTLSDGN
jgi:hypothetical protein